ncbi:MAG: sugar phosphate isomerase/epimerase [Actinomycetia bacterium]|nr:sugar phosphate isomerase/epimerase [Actinomycetes bacterium]MCP5031940.1 sugar phosphate isomerase/epimerase [Actinomycetes bacterium]
MSRQSLDVGQEIRLAAAAGYQGIEVWMRSLNHFLDQGGRLTDLRQLAIDNDIRIENAIGFAPWIVDDDDIRAEGLEQAERDMEILAQIGCRRIAAPPAGAADGPLIDLDIVAARFAELISRGQAYGVTPQLEIWGSSTNLHDLSQVLYVAAKTGRPSVKVLVDIYHLHRGGSDLNSLDLIDGSALEIVHVNDYPADIAPMDLTDADRVYPGDGGGPVRDIVKRLDSKQADIVLSLELFDPSLWERDPLEVARTGLQKMTDAVALAIG